MGGNSIIFEHYCLSYPKKDNHAYVNDNNAELAFWCMQKLRARVSLCSASFVGYEELLHRKYIC